MASPDHTSTRPRPHRAFRADLIADARRYRRSARAVLTRPWNGGEFAGWLILGPCLGALFATVAVASLTGPNPGILVSWIPPFGAFCGMFMSPIMMAGAWRRSLAASVMLQAVVGSAAAALAPWAVKQPWAMNELARPIALVAVANVVAAVVGLLILPRRPLAATLTAICQRCGYSRADLPSVTCPECGHGTVPTPP